MTETVSATPAARAAGLGFHLCIASAAAVLLLVSVAGCLVTHVQVPGVGGLVLAAVVVTAALQALPLYWHHKGRYALRDSSLCMLWAALLWIVLPFPVDVAGRLGRVFPLRDALLARADAHLGVSIPAIAHWAAQHWMGRIFNVSYALLEPLLILAFLLPGLTGKATAIKRLLVANLAAFAVGMPLFALVPAVGPWYGEHLAPRPDQALCQAELLEMRAPGPYVHKPAGVICFPSFHVMWAIICAEALFAFRWLRASAAIVAALIIVSTMTTGWHYFADVLGGVALAAVSLAAARWLVRS